MSIQLNIFLDEQRLNVNNILNKFISILGVRGSGKSNTSAVICEELLEKNILICIIDIDGEYFGLKEKYDILVIGGDNKDIELLLDEENIYYLVNTFLQNNLSIIFDLSELDSYDQLYFVNQYLNAIWKIEKEMRRPFFTILEESHKFIPQVLDKSYPLLKNIRNIASDCSLRGRKRGIGFILISQRSAKVNKDILSQAEIYFLHKIVHPVDYSIYSEISALPKKHIINNIQKLDIGEIYLIIDGTREKCKIRKKNTFDNGFSPKLNYTKEKPNLRKIKQEILNKFKIEIDNNDKSISLPISTEIHENIIPAIPVKPIIKKESGLNKSNKNLSIVVKEINSNPTKGEEEIIECYDYLYCKLKRVPTVKEISDHLNLNLQAIRFRISRFIKKGNKLKIFSESDKLYYEKFQKLLDLYIIKYKKERRLPYITEVINCLNKSYTRVKDCINKFNRESQCFKLYVINENEIQVRKNALRVKFIWNVLKPLLFYFGIDRNPTLKELCLECDLKRNDIVNALKYLKKNNVLLKIDDELIFNEYNMKKQIIKTICKICRENDIEIEKINVDMIHSNSDLTKSSIHKYRKILSNKGILPFMSNMIRHNYLINKFDMENLILENKDSNKTISKLAKNNNLNYNAMLKAKKKLIKNNRIEGTRDKLSDFKLIIETYNKNKDRDKEYILKKCRDLKIHIGVRLYQMKYENYNLDIPHSLFEKLLNNSPIENIFFTLSNENRIKLIKNCLKLKTPDQLIIDLNLGRKWINTIKYHLYVLQENDILLKIKNEYKLSNNGLKVLNLINKFDYSAIFKKRHLFLLLIMEETPQNKREIISRLNKIQHLINSFGVTEYLKDYVSVVKKGWNDYSYILTKKGVKIHNFLNRLLVITTKYEENNILQNSESHSKIDTSIKENQIINRELLLKNVDCEICASNKIRNLGVIINNKFKSFSQFKTIQLKNLMKNNKIICKYCYSTRKHSKSLTFSSSQGRMLIND
jgi:hypothetical protein